MVNLAAEMGKKRIQLLFLRTRSSGMQRRQSRGIALGGQPIGKDWAEDKVLDPSKWDERWMAGKHL